MASRPLVVTALDAIIFAPLTARLGVDRRNALVVLVHSTGDRLGRQLRPIADVRATVQLLFLVPLFTALIVHDLPRLQYRCRSVRAIPAPRALAQSGEP